MTIIAKGGNSGCVHDYLPSLPSVSVPGDPAVTQKELGGSGIQYCQNSGNREGEKNPPVPTSI